jgi:hypothetical protein
MRRSNELQVEDNFLVNGSRRGLLDCIFRLLIPESFRLFVPHEKSELSAEKTIQTILVAISQRLRNSLSLQLVASVNLIFSNLARQQSALREFPASWLFGFSFFDSLLVVREKGKSDGTSMKFGLSFDFAKAHENDSQLSRHYGSFAKYPKL